MQYRLNPLGSIDLDRLFPFHRDNRRADGFWDTEDATSDNVRGTSVDPHEPVWPRWKTTPPLHGEGDFISRDPFFDIDEITQRADFYPPGRPLIDRNVDGNPASRQRVNDTDAGNLWRRRLLVGPDGTSLLQESRNTESPPALWSTNSAERPESSYPEMRLAAAQPPAVAPRAQGQSPRTTQLAPENLEYGAFVARAINQALKEAGVLDTHYNDPDILAAAWDIAARPLANMFSTEVGARIFKVGDKWAVGPAFSNGRDCAAGHCAVNVGQAPFIPGLPRARDAGDIHTHPDNRGFSDEDLYLARIKSGLGRTPWTSYVGQENGEVYSVDQNRVRRRFK